MKFAATISMSLIAGVMSVAWTSAYSAELLGLYVGAGVGQSEVAASASYPTIANVYPSEFKEDHAAFKFMAGVRPILLVGAEIAFVDLGSPRGSIFNYPAEASTKGETAFGVLYLPATMIYVFAKLGVARIQTSLTGLYTNGDLVCLSGQPCGTVKFEQSRTNTGLAEGGGAQYKFGSWAVRAEYERFNAAGEHPRIVSLGLTWTFL